MTSNPFAKKLLIKPGSRLLVLNAPDGYLERLAPLPDGVELAAAGDDGCDVVHLFARNRAEVERFAGAAVAAVRPGGVLWISYPKRGRNVTTDLNRDTGWSALSSLGWRVVSQVAIDERWSALRFRPLSEVGG